MDKSAPNNTKYPPFPGPGTLGDKILHRVLREKFLEFPIKLPGQRLVVGDHQRRPVQGLDDIRHGEGLAGAGHAKKRLELIALLKAVHQLSNSRGLVAGGGVFRYQFEMIHDSSFRNKNIFFCFRFFSPSYPFKYLSTSRSNSDIYSRSCFTRNISYSFKVLVAHCRKRVAFLEFTLYPTAIIASRL